MLEDPKKVGFFNLVLNAHYPYIESLTTEILVEERCFFQTIIESYLPLLRTFKQLAIDNIPFKVTISFSSTLLGMLNSPSLQEKCLHYIVESLELAEKELERTKDSTLEHEVALVYYKNLQEALTLFDVYKGDILSEFIKLRDAGYCDIIASAASYAFLPLFQQFPSAIKAQIEFAVTQFKTIFGQDPKGFWLPHCGYFPGIEAYLEKFAITHIYTATHALLYADEPPAYGIYQPVQIKNSKILAFARDRLSINEIWSNEGFPNHPYYRDFYHDIGYSMPQDYLGKFILSNKERITTGFKYKAHSGSAEEKLLYNHHQALKLATEHAQTFVDNRLTKLSSVREIMTDKIPFVTTAFDMEFLGHWWFEGPKFIEEVFRGFAKHQDKIISTTVTTYTKSYQDFQQIQPAFSSSGDEDSYSQFWLDESNSWLLPHIFKAIEQMSDLAERFSHITGIKEAVLNLASREILLLMSSDWSLMIKTRTNADFAIEQIKKHLKMFYTICESVSSNTIYPDWIAALNYQNNSFNEICNYKFFSA